MSDDGSTDEVESSRVNDIPPDIWDIKNTHVKTEDFKKDNIKSEQVMMCTMLGVPVQAQADFFGVSLACFKREFEQELKMARVLPNARVAFSLFQKATSHKMSSAAVNAAIFWLKTQAGWKETNVSEFTGKDGAAIDVSGMNPVQRTQRLAHVLKSVKDRVKESA